MPGARLRRFDHGAFPLADLVERKARQGLTASLVVPARDEEATVAEVVAVFLPLRDAGLLDEVVVVDSLSTDGTAAAARAAGAEVATADRPGKGEAMWRGLQAARGDLVAYCDADLLDAGAHYALGLLGPLLTEPEVQLVKGYYRRPIVDRHGGIEEYGGRVTELAARPFLNLHRPELAQLVQPLAGEWAGRRALLESLSFPTGYGVEVAVLLDTHERFGLAGIAQVDLGVRTHRHQSQQALGVMAAEVLGAASRRVGVAPVGRVMAQYSPTDHRARTTPLALDERPPIRPA
jgi:glucosyl-3-phosphoglycerate synthase